MTADAGVLALAAAWLLTYALHSTVLLAAAEAVWRSRAGARAGEVAYRAALLGALLTTTMSTLVTEPAPRPDGGSVSAPAAGALAHPAQEGAVPAGAAAEVSGAGRRAVEIGEVGASAVLWLWLACALPLLAGRGVMLLRLWLLFRRRVPLAGGALAERLRRLAGEAGVRRVRLSSLAGLATPVAVGRGEICVPPQALTALDAAQQEAMLAHELAHLRRRDPAWLLAAHLLEAALWFQPLNRLARRRLVEAAEEAADRWAVERMGGGLALARCLVEVAGWSTAPARAPLVALAAYASHFQWRVERLLRGDLPQASPRDRATPAAAALAAACCLILTPGVRVAPDAAPSRILPRPPAVAAAPAPADPEWAARERRLDPQPLFHAVAAVDPAGDSYCWAVDGRPANPRCVVVIWTREHTRLHVAAADVQRLSADGLFRVRTPAGDSVHSLRVSAVDQAGSERLVLMTELHPDELPQGTPVVRAPARG